MTSLNDLIELYKSESANVFNNVSNAEITSMIDLIWETYQNDGTVFCCGNGGKYQTLLYTLSLQKINQNL